MPGRRPHRLRQVHAAARGQRAGAALHRRHAVRPGHRRRARHPHAPAARARRRGRRVGQDPLAGFVTDTVEDELAYGMESLGVPPDVMRRRVEETLDLLGLADAARPPAGHAVRRAAAAGRDRRGADRAPAGARAGRADLGAGPGRGRGGAGRAAAARARPRHRPCCWPSTGWSGWCSTPTGWCSARRRARAGRRRPRRGDGGPRRWRRRSSSSAGSPAGRRCRCRCATPAGAPTGLRRAARAAPRPGRRAGAPTGDVRSPTRERRWSSGTATPSRCAAST